MILILESKYCSTRSPSSILIVVIMNMSCQLPSVEAIQGKRHSCKKQKPSARRQKFEGFYDGALYDEETSSSAPPEGNSLWSEGFLLKLTDYLFLPCCTRFWRETLTSTKTIHLKKWGRRDSARKNQQALILTNKSTYCLLPLPSCLVRRTFTAFREITEVAIFFFGVFAEDTEPIWALP
jgi:hypothetical protein